VQSLSGVNRTADRDLGVQDRSSVCIFTHNDVRSHQLVMGLTNTPSDLLPEPLEMLILRALASGSKHGYPTVEHLRITSQDVLRVAECAFYPALQRLLVNGWARPEWGISENNRRARYHVDGPGRKQPPGGASRV
jgi:PadR family transcriptional regulator, regulatory protein PadR